MQFILQGWEGRRSIARLYVIFFKRVHPGRNFERDLNFEERSFLQLSQT